MKPSAFGTRPTMLYHFLVQIGMLVASVAVHFSNTRLTVYRSVLEASFDVSKVSATMISLNFCILLVTTVKSVRYLFKRPRAHEVYASCLTFWVIVHICAHLVNYSKLNILCKCFSWGPGISGMLAFVSLIVLVATPLCLVKNHYKTFHIVHMASAAVFTVFTWIHGTFCFFRQDDNSCIVPTFWIITLLPILFLLYERTLRYTRVYKVSALSRNELVIHGLKGQGLVYLCTSPTSTWHPFVLVNSSFGEESRILFNPCTKWTYKLCLVDKLLVDGPYKTILDSGLFTKNVSLVATGTGMTLFASAIKDCIHFSHQGVGTVQVIWVVKLLQDTDWFLETLKTFTFTFRGASLKVFVTGEEPVPGARYPDFVTFGRPNLGKDGGVVTGKRVVYSGKSASRPSGSYAY